MRCHLGDYEASRLPLFAGQFLGFCMSSTLDSTAEFFIAAREP